MTDDGKAFSLFAGVFLIGLLFACSDTTSPLVPLNKPVFVLDFDGCKVYKFKEFHNAPYAYFAKCEATKPVEVTIPHEVPKVVVNPLAVRPQKKVVPK